MKLVESRQTHARCLSEQAVPARVSRGLEQVQSGERDAGYCDVERCCSTVTIWALRSNTFEFCGKVADEATGAIKLSWATHPAHLCWAQTDPGRAAVRSVRLGCSVV